MEPNESEDRKMVFEMLKLRVDSIKHITTLATGTVVVTATFMDKLAKPLASSIFLIAAVISMLVCLVTSFILLWAMTLATARGKRKIFGISLRAPQNIREWLNLQGLFIDAVYFSFCLGIGSLGIFAVRNIALK